MGIWAARTIKVPTDDNEEIDSTVFEKQKLILILRSTLYSFKDRKFDNQSPLSFMDGFSIVSDTKISNISNFDNLSPEGASSAFPSTAPTPLTDETNREAKILRYKEKSKARKFEKKIRYTSRKVQAHNRGKFAKRPQLVPELDRMLSFEEFGSGIVPS
ncbi:hypothetical protein RJ639_042136 [Escallonia herrerae]|uniref:CCT domain-containing protein n=1 Tax=Escallonia herrerae TaxID=1293975 RepID=A0AA88WG68_9ASTE|nr:hypothetical protein RJ639_042136 [Escallonia herrerae]